MGLRCIVYIDDGICASESESDCIAAKETLLSDSNKTSLVISIEKCVLVPAQEGTV